MSGKGERVFMSSGAFRSKHLPALLESARERGITRVELSSGVAFAEENMAAVRAAKKSGMSFLVHNYFPPPKTPFVLNLASSDPSTLALARRHCRQAIDLCVEVGSPLYSVHSGFLAEATAADLGRDLTGLPISSRESAWAAFLESLIEIGRYAESRGISLAIENNVLAAFNLIGGRNKVVLCAEADEIVEILEAVKPLKIGLLLDVAHAIVSSNALGFDVQEFISRLSDRVVCLHVSENDGRADQNLPIREDSWFLPLLSRIRNVPVVLESYNLHPEEMASGLRYLTEAAELRQ